MEKQEMKNNFLHIIIWGALLMSQFIYTFVVFSTQGAFEMNLAEAEGLILHAIIAVFGLLAGLIVPIILIKGLKAYTYPEALQKVFVPFILKLVCYEIIVIAGLLLSFKNETNYMIPFLIVSVIAFLTAFPSEGKIKRATGLMRS